MYLLQGPEKAYQQGSVHSQEMCDQSKRVNVDPDGFKNIIEQGCHVEEALQKEKDEIER
jgi:hypothetical protein